MEGRQYPPSQRAGGELRASDETKPAAGVGELDLSLSPPRNALRKKTFSGGQKVALVPFIPFRPVASSPRCFGSNFSPPKPA
jgi:hypothetical protein